MPSFTTVFRAIVMFVAAGFVVKGWQSYGPSAEQVKSIALRALESTSGGQKQSEKLAEENAGLVSQMPGTPVAPHLAEASVGAPNAVEDIPTVASMKDISVEQAGFTSPSESLESSELPLGNRSISDIDAQHLSALLKRLEMLGGVEPKLTAWGTAGELYRFSCRATTANSPIFARHFEAVSREPRMAVENVVASVEAWRNSQLDHHPAQ